MALVEVETEKTGRGMVLYREEKFTMGMK